MFFHCRSSIIRCVTAQFQCSNRHLIRQISAANLQRISKEEREYNIPVPWGHIAVKEWGRKDGQPVLCLHGWMDNVDSFSPLMAMSSSDHRFISFDYSGHGLSSHRPFGCFYGVVEFSSDVIRVVEHLKLDKLHVMGHSLGSGLALWYSAMYPERVDKVICIDAVNAPTLPLPEQPEGYAKAIQVGLQHEKTRAKPPRSFCKEEAIDIMMKSGLSEVTSNVLLKRGTRLAEDGISLVWNRDPRLYDMMFALIDTELGLSIAKICKKDLLLFLTTNSMYKTVQDPDGSCREAFAKNCNSYKLVVVEGTHHAHIESPEQFALHVDEYL